MAQPTPLTLFADELRRARTAAELTQEGLAQLISYSASLIAKVEAAQRRPTRDFAERCDAVLGTGGLLARIHDVLGPGGVLPWFQEWATVEREAVALRTFQWSVVPGLLQTEAYARALLASGALLVTNEVEQQVTARLERQHILARDNPPHLTAVVAEHVLHHPVGGPEVMREQLRHLVKVCAERPRVRVQVVPTAVGAYVGLSGPLVLATLPSGGEVGFLDDLLYGKLAERPQDVASLRESWESIRGEALSHQQSAELIAEVAHKWT